jgi:molybdenum cofactor cytidylyltransferase
VIGAIVLAAGESTRMGRPKALLPDGAGRLFVTRLLHTFQAAGVHRLAVVTGAVHEAIVAAVARDAPARRAVSFVRNADPSRGQLSSLLAGLEVMDAPGVDAVLVTLVDVPFVAASTVRAVLDAWRRSGAPVVRPACGARHGHPVLFARAMFDDLRAADPGAGAKAVLRAHASRVLDVEIADEGALVDIDTREEYDRVTGL